MGQRTSLPFNKSSKHRMLLTPSRKLGQKLSTGFGLEEVSDDRTENEFLHLPETIYKDDPFFIPSLDGEVRAVFDPATNPYFRHGEAMRWILKDESGQISGRIAAFIDFEKMWDGDLKIGEVGFFECVDNKDAASLLFDTAIQWLIDNHNVDVVDGPVNFGENDKFWGLQIRGAGYPSYGMTYNPDYYQEFFEEYGFEIQYQQFTNYLDVRKPLPERFLRIAERVSKNPAYSFRHYRSRDQEKFVRDFVAVYNEAWVNFKGFRPMDENVVRKSLQEMKPVMEEGFIWFAYVKDRPVGLLVGVPDVNEILKFSGTKFNWWGKLKFLFYKKLKGFSCARVIVMGVVPDYQGHGLESAMILRGYEVGQRKQYKHVQLAWVGDFNDKMMAIHRAMGAVENRVHATYRKRLW